MNARTFKKKVKVKRDRYKHEKQGQGHIIPRSSQMLPGFSGADLVGVT